MAWRQGGSSNRVTVLSRSPLPNTCFVTASKSLHLSGDLTVLSQRRDNLEPNVLQMKHPQPHCTRWRFFVATDNLSAITVASSPLFKLLARITKPQNSTKALRQPSLKEKEKKKNNPVFFQKPLTRVKLRLPLSLV